MKLACVIAFQICFSFIFFNHAAYAGGSSASLKNENAFSVFASAVFFDTGKVEIKPEYETALRKLVSLLLSYPENKVLIIGHTDSSGEEKLNKNLSFARAKVIADYFVSNGINKTRINAAGYSSKEPASHNKTEDGKKRNRRAEIMILKNEK
ncbi:OmpA family protein [Endomicrobium proavitum]|uniref:OmpA-like domain-containing protein n=1 Tax=Endomicrobium proavitum TaxID=1408281 RepID=A0A0G3WK30_9BACT|nr:OmpA family protein [Endomicrobium proavitum]AKL98237.1 exported protein of unknown function [Endomicrobium proavitum]